MLTEEDNFTFTLLLRNNFLYNIISFLHTYKEQIEDTSDWINICIGAHLSSLLTALGSLNNQDNQSEELIKNLTIFMERLSEFIKQEVKLLSNEKIYG